MIDRLPPRPAPPLSLPHAQPPVDPALEPIVGNETVDDNIAECAQIAIWNVAGLAGQALAIAVQNGVVTLSGRLADATLRDRLISSVAGLRGVLRVVDETVTPQHRAPATAPSRRRRSPVVHWREPGQFAYVIRFCGLDEASMSAAIRQAIGELDASASPQDWRTDERLVVVYRNRQPHTVTLEIGHRLRGDASVPPSDDIIAGPMPAGAVLTLEAPAGLFGVLETHQRLVAMATRSGHVAEDHFWQEFAPSNFRPWRGHPAAPVYLPIRPHPDRLASRT